MPEHTAHLADCPSEIADVDKSEVTDDQIEAFSLKLELLGVAEAIIPQWIALPRFFQQRRRRVQADRQYPCRSHDSAEAAFAAADVEGIYKTASRDAAEHDRIDDVFSTPISAFANGGDPRLRTPLPIALHGPSGIDPRQRIFPNRRPCPPAPK